MSDYASPLLGTRFPRSTGNKKGIVASYSETKDRWSLVVVRGERVGKGGGENIRGEGNEEAVCVRERESYLGEQLAKIGARVTYRRRSRNG